MTNENISKLVKTNNNLEKLGFLGKDKRFKEKFYNKETPGPGHYDIDF